MVGVSYAFNYVESMDGLVTGLAAVACAYCMLVTIDSHQSVFGLASLVGIGTLAFLDDKKRWP